jgi:Family of unknown function (DUF6644)
MLMFITNPIGDAMNNTEWAFPLCECIHIVGFALSIGTVAIVDLRLLGLGMVGESPAQLLRDTANWTLAGLAVMLISGPLIFVSDPVMYLHNQSFRFKMGALLLAIIYNYTIHRKVASSGASPGVEKTVGALSLLLWVSVVAGGLFIAFV